MSFLQDIKDIFVPPSKSNGGGKAPGKDSATKTAQPRDPNKLRNPRGRCRYSPVTEQMINNHYKRRPFSLRISCQLPSIWKAAARSTGRLFLNRCNVG